MYVYSCHNLVAVKFGLLVSAKRLVGKTVFCTGEVNVAEMTYDVSSAL